MTKREIEALKSRHSIEQVIGQYVTLHRKGDRALGLCPFHNDHHPSLQVDIRRQRFVCFACGERGDVLAFICRLKGCSFTEAIEVLEPDKRTDTPVTTSSESRHPLTHQTQANADFVRVLLPYLPDNAELSDTYLRFGIGMAPHRMNGQWKKFAGRVIFPVRDAEGCLSGFAGRAVGKQTPKYINSSAAEGFHKGEILYGFDQARERIMREGCLFLTEGYKDVLAMHAAGYNHSVGLCGTALTEHQCTLFDALVEKVYIFTDGDQAGNQAAEKMALQLEERGIETFRILPPEGDDPDSLFRRLGKEGFISWIEKATHPPCISEQLLVAACRRYPHAELLSAQGGAQPLLSLLPGMLSTDQVPFEYPPYREWLEQGLQGAPPEVNSLGAPFSHSTADDYIEQIADEIRQSVSGSEKEQLSRFFLRLIYEYYETRIRKQIRYLTRRLRHESLPTDTEYLLRCLDERREHWRFVSKQLKRTAVELEGIFSD